MQKSNRLLLLALGNVPCAKFYGVMLVCRQADTENVHLLPFDQTRKPQECNPASIIELQSVGNRKKLTQSSCSLFVHESLFFSGGLFFRPAGRLSCLLL